MTRQAVSRNIGMQIDTRLLDLAPSSYNADTRTVDAVLSTGSPVRRFYGTEVLKSSREAVDLGRVFGVGVPVLDTHQQIGIANALGKVPKVWIANNALLGTLKFNQTPEGEKAAGMIERGEINGVSIGYRVVDWEIFDAQGNVIDPAIDRTRWDDDNLTSTASKWELIEISVCACPADPATGIRAFADRAFTPTPTFIAEARARMAARQRMQDREQVMRRGLYG
jgi:Caudovirus prohead serine protease